MDTPRLWLEQKLEPEIFKIFKLRITKRHTIRNLRSLIHDLKDIGANLESERLIACPRSFPPIRQRKDIFWRTVRFAKGIAEIRKPDWSGRWQSERIKIALERWVGIWPGKIRRHRSLRSRVRRRVDASKERIETAAVREELTQRPKVERSSFCMTRVIWKLGNGWRGNEPKMKEGMIRRRDVNVVEAILKRVGCRPVESA